jgi:hypothetical protein
VFGWRAAGAERFLGEDTPNMRVGSVSQNSRNGDAPLRFVLCRLPLVCPVSLLSSRPKLVTAATAESMAGGARVRPAEELATGAGACNPRNVRAAAAADFAPKSLWLAKLATAPWGRAVLAAAPWGARALAVLAARRRSRPAPKLGRSGPLELGRRGREEGPAGAHAGDRIEGLGMRMKRIIMTCGNPLNLKPNDMWDLLTE